MYVVTGRGLYVSVDGGKNFEERISRPSEIGNYPDGCVLHPHNPDLMFLSAAPIQPGAVGKRPISPGPGFRAVSTAAALGRSCKNGLPDRLQASVEALCLEAAGDAVSVFAATTNGDVYGSDDAEIAGRSSPADWRPSPRTPTTRTCRQRNNGVRANTGPETRQGHGSPTCIRADSLARRLPEIQRGLFG